MHQIGVVGGGAWGTALAAVAAAGGAVTMWAREPEVVEAINRGHINSEFLPDIPLPPSLGATGDIAEVCAADALLLAVPAQFVRAVTTKMAQYVSSATPIVICAKGIEQESGALMSEVLEVTLPGTTVAVLSGPTFAAEVARGQPTAVTLACRDEGVSDALLQRLGGRTFRPYLSADVIGAQVGGAVKNVLAIACGIVAGREFGDNAGAALITRGIAEMTRFGQALGAAPRTLMGLCGLGDLVLTCTCVASRNYSLGAALGRDAELSAFLGNRNTVAEGMFSASAVVARAAQVGVEMPISAAVDGIVNRGEPIDVAIETLLSRSFKVESEGGDNDQ